MQGELSFLSSQLPRPLLTRPRGQPSTSRPVALVPSNPMIIPGMMARTRRSIIAAEEAVEDLEEDVVIPLKQGEGPINTSSSFLLLGLPLELY